MGPFRYEPLSSHDSIRLLLLSPSRDNSAEIQCDLIQSTLRACKEDLIDQYTALSYVWGDPNEVKPILLDGSYFHVTRNLFHALRDLRDQDRVRRLWIDAICINQLAIDERNRQVSMMASIYSLAQHTVIYLGEQSMESEVVFAALQVCHTEKAPSVPLHPRYFDMAREHILSSAWFTRVWIFQELVLSRDPWVQQGRSRMAWEEFCSGIERLRLGQTSVAHTITSQATRAMSPPGYSTPSWVLGKGPHNGANFRDPCKILMEMRRIRRKYQAGYFNDNIKRPTLWESLLSRRGFGATDSRDLIFAHLGISEVSSMGEGLEVDYGKSVFEIYTETARKLIKMTQNLMILSQVPICGASQPGLPSWVPDWTVCTDDHPISVLAKTQEEKLPLPGPMDLDHPIHQVFHPHASLLVVDGFHQDTIQDLSPIVDRNDLIDQDLVRRFVNADSSGKQGQAFRAVYNAWCETPGFDFLPRISDDEHVVSVEASRTQHAILDHQSSTRSLPISSKLVLQSCRHATSFVSNRRIARFSSGAMGIVPPDCMIGDLACEYSFGLLDRIFRLAAEVGGYSLDKDIRLAFFKYYGNHEKLYYPDGINPKRITGSVIHLKHVSYIGECQRYDQYMTDAKLSKAQERKNPCVFIVH
ncbi:heterokaryon incompatibility protein-domain-containing protein [Cadophora sp. MPI-SDFR-AT-0126]|nr:heterokaryon incompatibility protein-domain-containing protein [Leotiomycetes sp. MPI-SDFR-AT-0126]